jgi:hypothetical protein
MMLDDNQLDDKQFEQKIKSSLDAQAQNLDADTRQLLANARRKALNQAPKTTWFASWFKSEYWLPASSLALCSLLAVFILVNPTPHPAPTNVAQTQPASGQQPGDALNQVAALELLANADDIDTATDPDFYLWADEVLATEGNHHA